MIYSDLTKLSKLIKSMLPATVPQNIIEDVAMNWAKQLRNYEVVDQGLVDGEPWYSVNILNHDIWYWLTQHSEGWHHYTSEDTGRPMVDMNEQLYILFTLRWS